MLLLLGFLVVTQASESPPPPPDTGAPPAAPAPAGGPAPPRWENIESEIKMTAEGTFDVCEAASLPLSLVPGIGSAVGTVTEWVCLIPAAIAVDTVALQFGGRDASLWQAVISLVVQKLITDAMDTPYYIAIGAAVAVAIAGTALLAYLAVQGLPLYLPALALIGGGTLLVAPVAWLRSKIGDFIFETMFFGLTNQLYGADLEKKQQDAAFKPGKIDGVARWYVLMAAASGTKAERELVHLVPVYGRFAKADDINKTLKERMRRVGTDVLHDPPRDLASMDGTIDALTATRAWVGAGGHILAITGIGFGVAGAVLPLTGSVDQATGDVIGFTGLGIAAVGLGVYALSTTVDTVKTFAVPCAYGW